MLYTLAELGQWVHLLARRAASRTDNKKRQKDLHDAQNYLSMMQDKLNQIQYQTSDLFRLIEELAPEAIDARQIYGIVYCDAIEDDKLGYLIPTHKYDWYDGNVLAPLSEFIEALRKDQPNLFVSKA